MNQPINQQDDVQGAGVYPADTPTTGQPPAGTPATSGVGVYDRPEGAGGGVNITTIVLMIVALLVVGAIIWTVIM